MEVNSVGAIQYGAERSVPEINTNGYEEWHTLISWITLGLGHGGKLPCNNSASPASHSLYQTMLISVHLFSCGMHKYLQMEEYKLRATQISFEQLS